MAEAPPPHTEPSGSKLSEPRLPPAYRLVALDRIGSTMDEARRLAVLGAEDGTIVWAREQTAGRGRQGRAWHSPPGNLYCSIVMRPDCALAEASQLSLVAAVALAECVGGLVAPMVELRLKWPNDLLLDECKAAGLLLEATTLGDGSLDFVILGLGLNIVSHPENAGQPATDLGRAGAEADVGTVLESFSRLLLNWLERWLDGDFERVRAAWLKRAKGLGETIQVRLGAERLTGLFVGLDEDGALLLETPQGRRRLTAGEIFFDQAVAGC